VPRDGFSRLCSEDLHRHPRFPCTAQNRPCRGGLAVDEAHQSFFLSPLCWGTDSKRETNQEEIAMLLKDILDNKGRIVQRIAPDATLGEAVQDMVRHGIGSLVVQDRLAVDGRIVGIITERDILRAHAARRAPLDELLVAAVMSQHLITAAPADGIERAMWLMTNHRVRHLPILLDNELYGIVSIGDIVKAQHDQLAMENHYMRSYIQGEGAEVATQ
jgi:CBS domain-containing protein